MDSRTDRLTHIQTQLSKMGIYNAERQQGMSYSGYNDKSYNACIGNHFAHASCVRKAKELNAENVLILEDDAEFLHQPGYLKSVLSQAIEELPEQWGLFYLGINMDCYLAHKFGKALAKLDGGYSTHAYAINRRLFDRIIQINEDVNVLHNDVYYSAVLMKEEPCFVTVPLLVGQLTNYSDIQGRVVDSNKMFLERFNSNLV